MKIRVKTKDKYFCIVIILVCLFVIGITSVAFYFAELEIKENIKPDLFSIVVFCIIYIYAYVALIKYIIRFFTCGITIYDNDIKIRVFGKKAKRNSLAYHIKGEKSDYLKYDFRYEDIKEYGIYDGNIYFILNNKHKIHFNKDNITDNNIKILFNKLEILTNISPKLENDFIYNYKKYDKYGKIVFHKQNDLYTKYEVREENNEYTLIVFRKKYLNSFKEYKDFENGLNVLWVEDETNRSTAKSLKSALKIAKDILE